MDGFLAEIEGVIVYTSRVGIMKEHIPFCREINILCIGYRAAVDHDV